MFKAENTPWCVFVCRIALSLLSIFTHGPTRENATGHEEAIVTLRFTLRSKKLRSFLVLVPEERHGWGPGT